MATTCLCKTLRPVTVLVRATGLFPLSWSHNGSNCVYSVSKFWMVYSAVMSAICFTQIYLSGNELKSSLSEFALPVTFSIFNECIYSSVSVILILCTVTQSKSMVKSLNNVSKLINAGLMCKSASRVLLKIQIIFVVLFLVLILIQISVLVALNTSKSFDSSWRYRQFIVRLITNIPFAFFLLFCTLSALYIALFGCFEKILIKNLEFQPVHPACDIKEINTQRTLFGLIKYDVCLDDHYLLPESERRKSEEVIEKLRCLHENICVSIRETNNAVNPHLLIILAVELAVVVIHWYSVIIYLKYENSTSKESSVNILNWMFIVIHTFEIFIFLRAGDQVINLVNGLNDFLLEFSTRHLSPAEHMQIRIFMNKLQYTPVKLNASGVVNISLGLAGPICGNVITYVLVALQFTPNK